jgi:hypothetical protein
MKAKTAISCFSDNDIAIREDVDPLVRVGVRCRR